ncbi:MAG: ferrochelatase [Eggerthellaceae bacterium]|nr:ferrochelatase [Eggerthellaceae bacterium]
MKTGIILANTGSPEGPEPDQVEAYLRQFLMDPRICQLPRPLWKYVVFHHILPKRKYTSSERYKRIWRAEGSPLINDQEKRADKVQLLFDAQGRSRDSADPVDVRIGMSYGTPSLEEVLSTFKDNGYDRVVLLPTYPQSAFSPTQAVIDAYRRALDSLEYRPKSVVIDNYHDNAHYISAVADAIRDAGYRPEEGDRLMLSMHSIPLKDKRAGDTYVEQTTESFALIACELGIDRDDITMSFQSVFGHDPSKWQGPLSLDVLAQWREEGFDGRVVFMCPGFAIDCLETLYDIPYEMCPAFAGSENTPDKTDRFVWVKTLGPTDRHATIMKEVVDAALGE